MSRLTAKLLFFVLLFLISSHSVFAVNPYATGSATVTASVISTTFNPPTLIAPSNNSTTKNSRESLVWKRPSPVPSTPLHHYDVYLDGVVFAASVSDSITTQVYYFYTIRRDNNTFYLDMTSDFTQGYHVWKVVAYDTSGINVSSDTWTFYIDSVNPFITLQKVDHQTLNWSTSDYATIPGINQRDLTITTADPLLTGLVEPYANMQIILLCPQNILHCTNQTYTGNYPTGIWKHRFYGLLKGQVYTVYLSATDAGGNSTIFPEFYLAYGLVAPTPSAIITPVPSTPPEASPTITPEPSPEIEIPPVPFTPVPPAAPTPPIFLTATPVPSTNYLSYLLILLVLGLPLHLLMTSIGTKTSFENIIRLLFTLFFPFLGRKTFRTIAFSTLELFHPDHLENTWQTTISDIKGNYSLKDQLPEKLFIKITSTGRIWKNVILPNSLLSQVCLFPNLETPQTPSNRLRQRFMTFRSLPLTIACLTSFICLITQPNYFYLTYLYLSAHLVFTEYLYPQIQK